MVWYDEGLKNKIEEFYKSLWSCLNFDTDMLKLHILPASFLENNQFEEIFLNHEKFRIKYKHVAINPEQFESEILYHLKFRDLLITNSKKPYKISYFLEWLDNELRKEMEKLINEFNKILEDYMGLSIYWIDLHFFPKYCLNVLNWSYQHDIIKGIDFNKIKDISSFPIYLSVDNEQHEEINEFKKKRKRNELTNEKKLNCLNSAQILKILYII